MRRLSLCLLTALAFTGVSPSQAADLDYDYLRGPQEEPVAPLVDWSGPYLGAHGGYTTTNFGYGKAGQSDLALMLQGLALEEEFGVSTSNKLRDSRAHGGSFGGFAGYNVQFDDTVFGIEVDYTSAFQKGSATGEISRKSALQSGLYDNYTITTSARATLQDYGTIRGRIGYAMGSFMPFATAGGAFGRALVGTTVRAQIEEYTDIEGTNLVGYLDKTAGSLKERYRFGATIGFGADYLITQNIFLRGEYQYLTFAKFGDTNVNVNTFRGALGIKF